MAMMKRAHDSSSTGGSPPRVLQRTSETTSSIPAKRTDRDEEDLSLPPPATAPTITSSTVTHPSDLSLPPPATAPMITSSTVTHPSDLSLPPPATAPTITSSTSPTVTHPSDGATATTHADRIEALLSTLVMRVDNLANDLADLKAAFAVRLDDISITTTNTLGCIESVASAIERATQETAATILEAHDNVLPRGMLVLTKKYKEGKPPSIPSKKYEGPLFLYLVDEVTHEILYDNVIYPIHFNTAGLTKRMVTEIAPGFQDALNWIGQPFQAIADAVAWMDDALRVYYTPPGTAIGDLHELIIKHDPKKSLCGLTRTVLAANNGRVVWTVKKRNSENRY